MLVSVISDDHCYQHYQSATQCRSLVAIVVTNILALERHNKAST